MIKIYMILCLILLSGCVNTGHIVSGHLTLNDTPKDMAGKTIILNDDCSPKEIELNIPYCGDKNIPQNEICTTTPDNHQYGYKIVQVINKNDALVCTMNGYGGCFGNIEYIKNLGAHYDGLVDDVKITDNILLKKKPYVYETLFGQKTVNGYELVTKAKFSKIKYIPNDKEKCLKNEYSYSKEYLGNQENQSSRIED